MKAVIVDSREPDHIKHINFGCPSMVQTLETGDLHIIGNDDQLIIVERKSTFTSDFMNSIKDGRLFNQVARAKSMTPFVYVAIIGSISRARNGKAIVNGQVSGWEYASIRGVKTSIQELGAIVIDCVDEDDFRNWIIIELNNRSRGDVIVMPVREAAVFGGAENVLASLPGIGAKKAADLLQHFPNVGSALWFLTDIDDKQTKIPGIAENTKRNIVRLLGGKLTYEPVGEIN